MKSVVEQRRFYKGIAITMMAVGAILLLISVWAILFPGEMCQDRLLIGNENVLANSRPAPCEPPSYPGIYLPSADSFIMIILSICLMAFGGVIIGMIIRLQK